MNNTKSFPIFSKFLSGYRNARGYSQADFKELLSNLGYKISLSTLKKYENGIAYPPVKFVIACYYSLRLSENQFESLIASIFADQMANLNNKYKIATEEFMKSGSFLVKNTKKPLANIFISYSRKDEKVAKTLAQNLKLSGFEYWLDAKDIAVGEPILDRVREGISKESDYVLIVLSKHSVNSEWCKLETRMAYDKELTQKRIIVIPVKIDETDVPEEIKIKKYFELEQDSPKSTKTLIKEIKHLHQKQRKRS